MATDEFPGPFVELLLDWTVRFHMAIVATRESVIATWVTFSCFGFTTLHTLLFRVQPLLGFYLKWKRYLSRPPNRYYPTLLGRTLRY